MNKKIALLGLIALFLIPLAHAKGPGRGPIQDFNCTGFPTNMTAGSTYTVNCTLENKANIPVPVIPELSIASKWNISKGEFYVDMMLNGNNLSCTDLSKEPFGLFRCYNGTKAYKIPGKSSNNLSLEYASNPALRPGTYNFALVLAARTPFGYAPGKPNKPSVTTVSAPENKTFNKTYKLPGYGNKTIFLEPNETWSYGYIEGQNMTIVPEENVTIDPDSTSYMTAGPKLYIGLNGTDTKGVEVYVGGEGRPERIWANASLIDFSYNSGSSTVSFNVSFSSPESVLLDWEPAVTRTRTRIERRTRNRTVPVTVPNETLKGMYNRLKDRLGDLRGRLDNLTGKLGTKNKTIKTLKGKISELKGRKKALEKRLKGKNVTKAKLRKKVENLSSRIGDLKEKLNKTKAGGGITGAVVGRAITSPAGIGSIIAAILILAGIGFYFFRKKF